MNRNTFSEIITKKFMYFLMNALHHIMNACIGRYTVHMALIENATRITYSTSNYRFMRHYLSLLNVYNESLPS